MILFRDAVAMVDQSPELGKAPDESGTGERCWNLAYMAQGAFSGLSVVATANQARARTSA